MEGRKKILKKQIRWFSICLKSKKGQNISDEEEVKDYENGQKILKQIGINKKSVGKPGLSFV